ncbi:MAG: hypothetical protein JST59_06900 [Actinobacteria bacterium]|nr:hypothetical protein [Actinomycetota bacterium]
MAAIFAGIEWQVRKRELDMQSRGWLAIPAPPPDQRPLAPTFWVYPPVRRKDGTYDLVVAGEIVNNGPADAYSVRIFAGPELQAEDEEETNALGVALGETVENVIAPAFPERDVDELYKTFVTDYKTRHYYMPLLRAGDRARFVVVAHYASPTPYLERIAAEGEPVERSRDWVQDHLQAHPVHAAERTALGRAVEFEPGDLCAPFEDERTLKRWEASLV